MQGHQAKRHRRETLLAIGHPGSERGHRMNGDASSIQNLKSATDAMPEASSGESAADMAWNRMFRQLVQYKTAHGHCLVPLGCRENPKLGAWLAEQAAQFHKRRLPLARQKALEELGFQWDFAEPRASGTTGGFNARGWDARFAELAAFKHQHGHVRTTMSNQLSAGQHHWRSNQRDKLRDGTLTPERKARLDALDPGWVFPGEPHHVAEKPSPEVIAMRAEAWRARFAQLAAFHAEHGHCWPLRRLEETRSLAEWLQSQRSYMRDGKLDAERLAQLESLRWLQPRTAKERAPKVRAIPSSTIKWNERFEQLAEFIRTHGHTRIPKGRPELKTLRSWVVSQRVSLRKGILNPEFKDQLDALGFDWNPAKSGSGRESHSGLRPAIWERRFQQLLDFKERHGHTRVAPHRGEDKKLGGWAVRQRVQYRAGILPAEQVRRLEEIGFQWSRPPGRPGPRQRNSALPRSETPTWEVRYAELLAFHAQHGHVRVPTKYPANRVLGNWVSNTRIMRKLGQLSAGRIAQLDALGFIWVAGHTEAIHRSFWESRYAELLQYTETYGHPHVPTTYRDHRLATWVTQQRVRQRKGRLSADKKEKLDALGFRWPAPRISPKNRTFDQRVADLAAYKKRYGHPHVSSGDIGYMRLVLWARMQRVAYDKDLLPQDRIDKLNAIGFAWDGVQGVWERTLLQWRAVARTYGTLHIPILANDHRPLAQWEALQRGRYNAGLLSPERISMLKDASFLWDVPPDTLGDPPRIRLTYDKRKRPGRKRPPKKSEASSA